MLTDHEIQDTLSRFGLTFQNVTKLYDTSHGEDDKRFNYILDDRCRRTQLTVESGHLCRH